MIEQIIPSLISLIVGCALTLCVTYFSQTMTRKGDKNKIRREKLEEAYILLGELKYWLRVQHYRLHLYAPTIFNDKLNDIYDKQFQSSFWLIGKLNIPDIDTIKYDCPIERIVMLISLYAPPLKTTILSYQLSINFILQYDPKLLTMEQEIWEQANEIFSDEKSQEDFIKILKLLKMEEEIKRKPANEVFSVKTKQEVALKILYGAFLSCEEIHQTLQSSLEKIIVEI